MPRIKKVPDEAPHRIDVIVGVRIRQRRHELGVSRKALGDRIGISFQQIQKYENAQNRISASRLADIAEALEISMIALFADFDTFTDDKHPHPSEFSDTAMRAAVTINQLSRKAQGTALLSVRAIAQFAEEIGQTR